MQVLIIEDNAFIRENLALTLSQAGHSVVAQLSCYETAIRWLAKHPWPEACVVDLDLGNTPTVANACGEEGRRLLALLSWQAVPTVIYTGYSREAAMLDGLDTNATYVSKSDPPDVVIGALTDLVHSSREKQKEISG